MEDTWEETRFELGWVVGCAGGRGVVFVFHITVSIVQQHTVCVFQC